MLPPRNTNLAFSYLLFWVSRKRPFCTTSVEKAGFHFSRQSLNSRANRKEGRKLEVRIKVVEKLSKLLAVRFWRGRLCIFQFDRGEITFPPPLSLRTDPCTFPFFPGLKSATSKSGSESWRLPRRRGGGRSSRRRRRRGRGGSSCSGDRRRRRRGRRGTSGTLARAATPPTWGWRSSRCRRSSRNNSSRSLSRRR